MKILLLNHSIIFMRKLYYSISEVCQLIDEEQHILRYWEKEFPQLKPKKNRGGNRIYSEKDLFLLMKIKKLLRQENMLIKSAKEKLSELSMEELDEGLFAGNQVKVGLPQKAITTEAVKIDNQVKESQFSREELEEMLSVFRRFAKILRQN
jgi:DNA-binding transcriptional MerR regulator